MKIQIGIILKKLRKKHQYNQGEIAIILGISRPTYLRYEQSRVEIPLSKLFELARLYNIDIFEMIGLISKEINKSLIEFSSSEAGNLVASA